MTREKRRSLGTREKTALRHIRGNNVGHRNLETLMGLRPSENQKMLETLLDRGKIQWDGEQERYKAK